MIIEFDCHEFKPHPEAKYEKKPTHFFVELSSIAWPPQVCVAVLFFCNPLSTLARRRCSTAQCGPVN
jgi:hypothetical protein